MVSSIRSMSPIERATCLLNSAADAGLDWTDAEDVWSRINEELAGAKAATEDISTLGARIGVREGRNHLEGDRDCREFDAAHKLLREELGELLFAVIDICRLLQVDPRAALEVANAKFDHCLAYLTDRVAADGLLIGLESPERIRRLWGEALRKCDSGEKKTIGIEQRRAVEVAEPKESFGTA